MKNKQSTYPGLKLNFLLLLIKYTFTSQDGLGMAILVKNIIFRDSVLSEAHAVVI